jgi:hypothetical protein
MKNGNINLGRTFVEADKKQIQGMVHEHNEILELFNEIETWRLTDGRFLTFPMPKFLELKKKYFE